jgi:hypothetical protein
VEARLRQIDRTLLVQLEGALTEPDLAQLGSQLDAVASRLDQAICDVERVKPDANAAAGLAKLKKRYETNRIRFVIVSSSMPGADAKSVPEALGRLKSAEAARLAEVMEAEAALGAAREAAAGIRAELLSLLRAPDPASPVEPLLAALETRHARLRQLFKTLSSELLRLEGDAEVRMPGPDDADAVRVAQTKLRALDKVRASGALD